MKAEKKTHKKTTPSRQTLSNKEVVCLGKTDKVVLSVLPRFMFSCRYASLLKMENEKYVTSF